MIYVYKNLKTLFQNWDKESRLLIVPSHNISPFLIEKLSKFGLTTIDENVKERVLEMKTAQVSGFPELDVNLLSKANGSEADKLFNSAKKAIKEGKDVFMDNLSFVLFIEWTTANFKKIDTGIYFDSDTPESLSELYAFEKLKLQKMTNLDSLLKLTCMFYNKGMDRDLLRNISLFQANILNMNLDINEFKKIKTGIHLQFIDEHKRILIDKVLENLKISIDILEDGNTFEDELYPTATNDDRFKSIFMKWIKPN